MTTKKTRGPGEIKQRAQRGLRHRPDGRWERRGSYRDAYDHVHPLSGYGKTQAEAIRKYEERAAELRGRTVVTNERATVGEWLVEYLGIVKMSRRASTYLNNRYYVETLDASFKNLELRQVTAGHIQRLVEQKLERTSDWTHRKHNPDVVHQSITGLLRVAFKEAIVRGAMRSNPALAVRRPNVAEVVEDHVITIMPADIPHYLDVFKRPTPDHVRLPYEDAKWRAMFYLALREGLRVGESCGLAWKDVNFEGRKLHIRRQVRPAIGGGLELMDLKTPSSRRDIELFDDVAEVLKGQRARVAAERLKSKEWQDLGLVFPVGGRYRRRAGGLSYASHAVRALQALVEQEGLPAHRGLIFHSLRRTCATFLKSIKMADEELKEFMGHSDISTTYRSYVKVVDSSMADALSRANRYFAG